VIWAIVAIFRGSDWTWRRPHPEQILAERFAAGEIDQDEYQRRLEALRSADHHSWERQR
jgi:putative membrane protein